MKKWLNFLKKIVLCGTLIFLFGCTASTRPNVSVVYHSPTLRTHLPPLSAKQQPSDLKSLPIEVETLFIQLYALDPLLALEVGKLPEFQENIGKNKVMALTRFIDLIEQSSIADKDNLTEFLKIGLPDVRRYCAPLQAIFWLLEKNEYDPKESPLNCNWPSRKMCLSRLLGKAWNFSEEDRWKDYKVVTERLNSPELVDYYEKRRFIYVFRPDHAGRPYSVFKTNMGQCADVTLFTVECLKKGGYEAWDYHVPSPSGYSYHHVTRFIVGGKHYIMDNGRPDMRGIVPMEKYSPR